MSRSVLPAALISFAASSVQASSFESILPQVVSHERENLAPLLAAASLSSMVMFSLAIKLFSDSCRERTRALQHGNVAEANFHTMKVMSRTVVIGITANAVKQCLNLINDTYFNQTKG